MRLSKTVTLGDREVTVRELRAKDIRRILEMAEAIEDMDLDAAVEHILPMVCDLPPAELDEMGLSALMVLWDAAREVNAAFFDLARRAGLTETAEKILAEMKGWIEQGLTDASAALSSGDTQTPPTTAGSSS